MVGRTARSAVGFGWRLACGLAPGALCALVACSGGEGGPSSPTSPTATPKPALVSVSPALLVEGSTAVLSGTDFASTPAVNVVTIDGVAATVTAATTTQLTVTVPTFDCRPQRTVNVQVSVGGKSSDALAQAVKPADFVDVDVGKMTLIEDPENLWYGYTGRPPRRYAPGIGASRRWLPSAMPQRVRRGAPSGAGSPTWERVSRCVESRPGPSAGWTRTCPEERR